MTPEIIARVDRWLASRKAWLLSAEYRDWLHHEWRLAVDRYNSHERSCRREAVAAALSGLLLALVREAWGPGYTVRSTEGQVCAVVVEYDQDGTVCFVGHGDDRFIRALEASSR